jgi:isopenicillin-N epimerase
MAARHPGERDGNDRWGEDWPSLRDQWALDPDVAHLNHGSFGAVPLPVRAGQEAIRAELDANPMRFLRRELPHRLARAREEAARFCGADPRGFSFLPNIMTGVDTVLAGVGLRAGDEVLLTDHAYGAVRLAAHRACARTGATVRTVALGLDAGDEERVDSVVAGVTGRTRLAIVAHTTSSALVLPVARIVAALRLCGVTVLVDAAHAPGTTDADADALGADFWLGAFHKWVCAPHGTAGLVVAPYWRARLRPLVTGWEIGEGYPVSFAVTGTVDPTGQLAVPLAIRFLESLGTRRVRAHNQRLAAYGAEVVSEALGTSGDRPRGPFHSMTLVPLPARARLDTPAAKALQDRIAAELATEVSVTARDGRGWMRLSAHVYNAPAQYERLAEAAWQVRRWL